MNESTPFEVEDTEGHLLRQIDGPDQYADQGTEGRLRRPTVATDEDDVEGHVQPPRGDDTDHIHSIMRY